MDKVKEKNLERISAFEDDYVVLKNGKVITTEEFVKSFNILKEGGTGACQEYWNTLSDKYSTLYPD